MSSGTVRLALAVTLLVFLALLGGGLYAAQRHDDLLTVQTAVHWHAVHANNEAQRLSIFAERYFSGDDSVDLPELQARHATLMAEMKGMREGPYARDLLSHADLDVRFAALEIELDGLGNVLKTVSRDNHAALRNVRLCLENTVLALTDAVTVAVRRMAGPQTASYWANLLYILYFSIAVAAAGLAFLTAVVIAENSKSRVLADQYRDAMAKADAANRAKSRMLANVSHELRTPLNAIIGFSDILRDQVFGALGNPRYRDYSGYIRDSGTHLLMLVNDLLNYAKYDDGEVRLTIAPVALPDILHGAARDAVEDARRNDVAIDFGEFDAPTVLADARAVRRIAANLINHAIRHSPEKGVVEITLAFHSGAMAEDGRIVIHIKDRGPGISKDDVERLLHPFELLQSDSFIAAPDGSAGFGLALANVLAEKHGGSITLEGREGGGTVAAFTLPLVSGQGPAGPS